MRLLLNCSSSNFAYEDSKISKVSREATVAIEECRTGFREVTLVGEAYTVVSGEDTVVSGDTAVVDGVTVVSVSGTVLSGGGVLGFEEDSVVVETCTEGVREDAVTEEGALISKGHTGIGGGIGKAAHVSTFWHAGSAGRFEGTGKLGDPFVSLVTSVKSERTG